MKNWIASAAIGVMLIACKEVKTEIIRTASTNSADLVFITKEGELSVSLGRTPVTIRFSDSEKKPSEVIFTTAKNRKAIIHLPAADDVLHTLEPMRIQSDVLGQPFDLVIDREIGPDFDIVGINFLHPFTNELLGTVEFQNRASRAAYDEESGQFLRNYQKVKQSQRVAVVPIDARIDDAWNGLVNFASILMIAPWLNSKYVKVYWIIGEETNRFSLIYDQWKQAIEQSPVIDYFPFVHAGVDSSNIKPVRYLPLKEHQLRYAYTSGCYSGSASRYIADYNAAIATGHRETSASPLFSFTIVRQWTYGKSIQEAVKIGWEAGKKRADDMSSFLVGEKSSLNYWNSVEDLLHQSEPMISWTREMHPMHLTIEKSAVPARVVPEDRDVYQMTASEIEIGNARIIGTLGARKQQMASR